MDTQIDAIRERLVGTTIDLGSLLSTDYFNHFNEVIMLLGMLPDMPEMLEDVDAWEFATYCEHFDKSGLAFAPLAIEAYQLAPRRLRERLDKLAVQMSMLIVETRVRLRYMLEVERMDKFREISELHSLELQGMVDDGGAIIHGNASSSDQSAVDALF
ncbi:MAG: hypothetical protein IPK66_10230 [Rhodospirillales bacterium]|nr:hypothetical protein [Rhodospirillales bacterium]